MNILSDYAGASLAEIVVLSDRVGSHLIWDEHHEKIEVVLAGGTGTLRVIGGVGVGRTPCP